MQRDPIQLRRVERFLGAEGLYVAELAFLVAGEGVVGAEELGADVGREGGVAEDGHEVVECGAFAFVEDADDAFVASVAVVVVAGDIVCVSCHCVEVVRKSCASFLGADAPSTQRRD